MAVKLTVNLPRKRDLEKFVDRKLRIVPLFPFYEKLVPYIEYQQGVETLPILTDRIARSEFHL